MPHRSPLVIVAERQACLGGRMVPYVVKRSPRARHVRFEIKSRTGLTVVIPRHCRLELVDGMVESKSRWILQKLDKHVDPVSAVPKAKLRFGDTIPLLGQEIRIVRGESASMKTVRLLASSLVICCDGEVPDIESVLEAWYRVQASVILQHKTREYASSLDVRYGRLSIRGQRTRWGSCSLKGTLSFNWRLIMAPECVVDYVVIHELAHLKEMNHTSRFWRLVAERCPSWREHKKWLDDNGARLAAVLGPTQ